MSVDATVALRAAADHTPGGSQAKSGRPPAPTSRMPRRGLLVALLAALLAAGTSPPPPPGLRRRDQGRRRRRPVRVPDEHLHLPREGVRRAGPLVRRDGGPGVHAEGHLGPRPLGRAGREPPGLPGPRERVPNPYSSRLDPNKVNGLGLNPSLTSGNTRTAYYGEYYVRTQIKLAPNAVVIYNHACYTAGSSEPGRANPTLSVARQRVDNHAAAWLRTGARTVFAETLGRASYIIKHLFTSSKSMSQVFWASPDKTWSYRTSFASKRTPGATGILDPRRPGAFYRAVVGELSMTASDWRP